MTYLELKKRQEQEVHKFPMGAAFSKGQFIEMKEKLNVKDDSELLNVGGGCFIRKIDEQVWDDMFKKHKQERDEFLKIQSQFKAAVRYELDNNEFIYTLDYEQALDALGLEYDSLTSEQLKLLKEAATEARQWDRDNN